MTPLEEALLLLDTATEAIATALADYPVSDDVDEVMIQAANDLDSLRNRVSILRATEQPLCTLLGQLLRSEKDGIYEAPGCFVQRRGGGKSYKGWKHSELIESVIPVVIAGPVLNADGEILDDGLTEDQARLAVTRMTSVNGWAWKPGGLKKAGITPDNYADFEAAPVSIVVRISDPAETVEDAA